MSPNNNSCGCAIQDTVSIACPHCKKSGNNVDAITIKSQLKKEKKEAMRLDMNEFNFCTNPQCDTVYYSNDGTESFAQADVKAKVTIKNSDPKTPLCYCRKLLKKNVLEMIKNKDVNIAGKVKAIIADGKSFCEKSNPRGTCCTQDVTDFLAEYRINYKEVIKPKFSLFTNQETPSSCC